MLLKGWLLVVVAMAIAVICMMFIKDGENKSVKRCYLERMGVLVFFAILVSVVLYKLPTAFVVNNDKTCDEVKVIGKTSIDTEWGVVILMDELEQSAEYVVNKGLDTLVLFPIIYSKAGYKAYDTSSLTDDVVDIPPCEYRKAMHHVSTFFVFPDEDLLKITEPRLEHDYALLTRAQLNFVINSIVIGSVAAEEQ